MNPPIQLISILLAFALPLSASTVIYSEDFTSVVLPTTTQSTLGHYAPYAAFGEISVAADAVAENGALTLKSNSNFRGVGIALDGANLSLGTYTVSFDILSFVLSHSSTNTVNDYLEASAWAAHGYQQGSNDGVILNAQTGDLGVYGNATVSELGNTTVLFSDATNTGTFDFSFNYTGTDAVVLYFGAVSDGWPFPEIVIDNISLVGGTATVPEPSSALLLSLSSLLLFRRKR